MLTNLKKKARSNSNLFFGLVMEKLSIGYYRIEIKLQILEFKKKIDPCSSLNHYVSALFLVNHSFEHKHEKCFHLHQKTSGRQ